MGAGLSFFQGSFPGLFQCTPMCQRDGCFTLAGHTATPRFAKKEQAAGSGGVAEPSVRSRDLRLEAAKFEGGTTVGEHVTT